MLRMEIALFLVLGFVAYMYDSAERTRMARHRTFSALLAATLVQLVFDALTLLLAIRRGTARLPVAPFVFLV